MAALANAKPRRFNASKLVKMFYPKSTAAKVWDGAFLTHASGKVENVDAANEVFAGIATETREAAETGVEIALEGMIVTPTAPTGASGTSSVGSAVYLGADNDTLTLTSTGNAALNGKIVAYDAVTLLYTISFKSVLL